jgi:hypothetical protein
MKITNSVEKCAWKRLFFAIDGTYRDIQASPDGPAGSAFQRELRDLGKQERFAVTPVGLLFGPGLAGSVLAFRDPASVLFIAVE